RSASADTTSCSESTRRRASSGKPESSEAQCDDRPKWQHASHDGGDGSDAENATSGGETWQRPKCHMRAGREGSHILFSPPVSTLSPLLTRACDKRDVPPLPAPLRRPF